MNISFCNITDIPKYNGYQIKLNTPTGEALQIYCGGRNAKSLKQCLSKRNSLYEKHDTLPKGILLSLLQGPIKSLTSSSGYHGVYDHIHIEKNGDEVEIFSCSLRNLITGRVTNKQIRKHNFRSDKKALEETLSIREKNIFNYNLIATLYNDMLYNDCIKIANQESRDAVPRLHNFIKFDRERWSLASTTVFPNGFLNNTEPV